MILPVVALMAISIKPEVEAVPYRQPQLASAHGLTAMAFGGGKSIYAAVSRDQGRTFGAPVKVRASKEAYDGFVQSGGSFEELLVAAVARSAPDLAQLPTPSASSSGCSSCRHLSTAAGGAWLVA